MKWNSWSFTAPGLIFGGAARILMYLLLDDLWWLGLTGVGLVLGAGIDANKGTGEPDSRRKNDA